MTSDELIYVEEDLGVGKGLKVVALHGRCEVRTSEVVLRDGEGAVVFRATPGEVSVVRQRFPGSGTYLVVGGDRYFVRTALAMSARPGTAVANLLAGRRSVSALEVAIDLAAGRIAAESAPDADADADADADDVPDRPAARPPDPDRPEEPVARPSDPAAPADGTAVAAPGERSGHVDLGIPGVGPGRLVGSGGFGRVYVARHLGLDAVVAVKVLDAEVDDRAAASFRKEAQALGRLRGHPHIVTVYDEGFTAGGQPYLLMEYAPSGSLSDRVRRTGAQPWADAVAAVVKLCGAAETAHRAGVLHRDIKAANVLVSAYGEPQLTDFGLSRFHDREGSRTANLTMTLAYAAPELLADGRATVASDVYALGATLVTLVTGRPPFSSDADTGPLAMVRRIDQEPPPTVSDHGAPVALDEIVAEAMAKDPAARPPSAAALGERLRALQVAEGLAPTEMLVAGAAAGEAPEPDPGGRVAGVGPDGGDLDGATELVGPDLDPLEGATVVVDVEADPGPVTPPPAAAPAGDGGPPVADERDGAEAPEPPPAPARRSRTTAILAAAAAAVLIVVVLVLVVGGGAEVATLEVVANGSAELGADDLVGALGDAGIDASVAWSQTPTVALEVDRAQLAEAVTVVASIPGAIASQPGGWTGTGAAYALYATEAEDLDRELLDRLAADADVVALSVTGVPRLGAPSSGGGLRGAVRSAPWEVPRVVWIELAPGTDTRAWYDRMLRGATTTLYPTATGDSATTHVYQPATPCSGRTAARGPVFTRSEGSSIVFGYLVVPGDDTRSIAVCLSTLSRSEIEVTELAAANPDLGLSSVGAAPREGVLIEAPPTVRES